MNNRLSILITGAKGVIGSALTQYLSKQGFHIDGLDLPGKIPENIPHKSIIFEMNLNEPKGLTKLVSSYDVVVHLAGFSRIKQAVENPLGAIQANILATAVLLEAIRKSKNRPSLLIASSIEVNVTDEGSYDINNLYGTTKAVCELISHRYASDYGLSIGVARIPGVYGSMYDYADKVPLVFIKKAIKNEDIYVHKNSMLMKYVHIDHLCSSLLFSIEELSKNTKPSITVFEIKGEKEITLLSLVKEICKITNSKSNIYFLKNKNLKRLKSKSIDVPGPYSSLQDGLSRLINKVKSKI